MLDRFETFATTIARVNRCVQKIKEREMNAVGLKGIHAMLLYMLGKHPEGLTASQLCDMCGEDKAAISRAVSLLTETGDVRVEDTAGKRAYRTRIFLTGKGEDTMTYVNERVESALQSVGAWMSDDQRDGFYTTLTGIVQRLEAYEEKD